MRAKNIVSFIHRNISTVYWPAKFAARTMYASLFHDGAMWLVGGWHGDTRQLYNDVWRSEDGLSWTRVSKNAPWQPRSYFSAVSFRSKMWIFGGFIFSLPSNVLGDVWSSANGRDWELVTDHPQWEDREHYGVAVFRDRLILFGGVTYANPSAGYHLRAFSDVWSSEDGARWQLLTDDAPWGPRRGFGYAVFNQKLWLFGGYNSQNTLYNDVWSSEDGISWEQSVDRAPWTPRGTFSHAVFNGRMWILGGNTSLQQAGNESQNDVWSSADGDHWQLEAEHAPWLERSGANPVVRVDEQGEELWLISGTRYPLPERVLYNDAWSTRDGVQWIARTDSDLYDTRCTQLRVTTGKCLNGQNH